MFNIHGEERLSAAATCWERIEICLIQESDSFFLSFLLTKKNNKDEEEDDYYK